MKPQSIRRILKAAAFAAMSLAPSAAAADTSAFRIVEDASITSAVEAARTRFLAMRTENQPAFKRLNACVLLDSPDGTWRRGGHGMDATQYPASCVKLAYMAAAMDWERAHGKPVGHFDADTAPMIVSSDNVATGRVVDDITTTVNHTGGTSDPAYAEWAKARGYTERYLDGRGLLGAQTILHKTYPTNSGEMPQGFELALKDARGPNLMTARLSASLMLEITKGALEPRATAYMRKLLTHDRWDDDSVSGFGVPPGATYENKPGVAYDTLEDIAYIKMPGNGREMILAVFSNAYSGSEKSQANPYDGSILGVFTEMLIEGLGLDQGAPAKIKRDDGQPGFTSTGDWKVTSGPAERFGPTSRVAAGAGSTSPTATATWALDVPEAGRYEVSVWYPQGPGHAKKAQFAVTSAGGAVAEVTINQTKAGGRWVRLGDYEMAKGGGSVTLTNAVDSDRTVAADAVKAVRWP